MPALDVEVLSPVYDEGESHATVSYTHLDVYKRQGVNHSGMEMCAQTATRSEPRTMAREMCIRDRFLTVFTFSRALMEQESASNSDIDAR